jgi:hypothetical protein
VSANIPVWQWWNAPEGEASIAEVIDSLRTHFERDNTDRIGALVAMRAVYLDIACDYYAGEGFYRTKRSRYNLMQGAVDSTHAQITASRPRPKVVTVGQDDSAQRRAELRQRWIDGEYERVGAYEKLSEMALDGLIYGTGCLKVGSEDGRPVVDRVWCGDLWVDPREERFGRVRTLYQAHALDRDVAMLEYPDDADEIAALPALDLRDTHFADLRIDGGYEARNLIGLVEAWRLPTASKARRVVTDDGKVTLGAGRHVVVCSSKVLVDEEWDHPTFPFVFFRWAPDPQRFWAQGMVERGAGMQSDLNQLTETIQKAYAVMVPQFWLEDGAMVQGVTDVVGAVNRCKPSSGDVRLAVQVLSPDVGPGLLQREQEIAQRFMHVLGVDALQAKAEKPAGLNSGAALQNYKDSVSVRFMPQGRRYDQTTVDLANLLFYFADKLAGEGHDQTVRVYGQTIGLEIIRYDDIKPQGDEVFEVRVQPASALPKDAAGRMQFLYDVQALGVPMDPGWIAKTLEMPDIEALVDEVNAPRMLVMQAVADCFHEDAAQPQANAYWPLMAPDGSPGMAIQLLTRQVQLAMYKGADPDAIERLMRLHGQARGLYEDEKAKLSPPAPPATPMGPGAPTMAANGPVPGQPPDAPPPAPMGEPQPPEMSA